jgi:hypothetical protein
MYGCVHAQRIADARRESEIPARAALELVE